MRTTVISPPVSAPHVLSSDIAGADNLTILHATQDDIADSATQPAPVLGDEQVTS